jgi:hypothetical protein
MIGLYGLSYAPLIEIRIPLQVSSMVHQKYKLKFFHYQGLSFIFLLKVHVASLAVALAVWACPCCGNNVILALPKREPVTRCYPDFPPEFLVYSKGGSGWVER